MAYTALNTFQKNELFDYLEGGKTFSTPAIKLNGRESPAFDKNNQGQLRLPTPKRNLETFSHMSRSDIDSFYDRIGGGPLYKRK